MGGRGRNLVPPFFFFAEKRGRTHVPRQGFENDRGRERDQRWKLKSNNQRMVARSQSKSLKSVSVDLRSGTTISNESPTKYSQTDCHVERVSYSLAGVS